jgi:2-keto-3-deoxy-L-rhamnonate aldolase RhmA
VHQQNFLQEQLGRGEPVWGGWITGPSSAGPREFVDAGYDFIGLDVQHSYFDDAAIARILHGLEHLGVPALVRMPTTDSAPIGRVLDAGADGVIIAMVESVEQVRAAVSATRYQPTGVRSFGPLRADIGEDMESLESRVSVFVMIETAAAVESLDEICSVHGLSGIYVGPMDLAIAMGHPPHEAWTNEDVIGALARIAERASAFELIAGIHAGDGSNGRLAAQLGYQMITLSTASEALRDGASAHLAHARMQPFDVAAVGHRLY